MPASGPPRDGAHAWCAVRECRRRSMPIPGPAGTRLRADRARRQSDGPDRRAFARHRAIGRRACRRVGPFRVKKTRQDNKLEPRPQFPEEVPHIAHEGLGLLESGEMAALWHLAPVPDVRIGPFHPAPHRSNNLPGKYRDPRRDIDLVYGAATRRETLPIKTSRRGRTCRHPIQHDVVEQFVATEHVLGIAVAIGPGPELLEDPRRLTAWRIGEAIAERLRPSRLLLGVTGIPIPIVLDTIQSSDLLTAGLSLDVRPHAHGQRDVDAGTVVRILRSERGRDC